MLLLLCALGLWGCACYERHTVSWHSLDGVSVLCSIDENIEDTLVNVEDGQNEIIKYFKK